MPISILDTLFEKLEPEKFNDNPLNYLYNHSLSLYSHLIDNVFQSKRSNTSFTRDYLVKRFHNYLTLGGKSWYNSLDINYPLDKSSSELSL